MHLYIDETIFFFFIFCSIPLVDVLSILEQEDEEVHKIYITPPNGEVDGDSDGDSREEDEEGYVDNLGRKLSKVIQLLSFQMKNDWRRGLSCTRLRILLNTICRKPGFNSLRTPLNHGTEQASNETLKQTQQRN